MLIADHIVHVNYIHNFYRRDDLNFDILYGYMYIVADCVLPTRDLLGLFFCFFFFVFVVALSLLSTPQLL